MKAPPTPVEPFLDPARALACVHCGLCLSACPTYLETGNENDSPRGRIHLMRALQEGRLAATAEPVRHLDLCLGCRACESACPSGVRYGDLLEHTREHIESHYRRSAFQLLLRRLIIGRVFPNARAMRLLLHPARLMKRILPESLLPGFLVSALELIPARSPARPVPERSLSTAPVRRGSVGFIQGCVMSVMFGATNAATVRLLNRAGYDVLTPPSQGCCGALHAHGGALGEARARARNNIAAFEAAGLDAIVVNAAGCGSTLKDYGELLREDPEWAERARRFAGTVRDLTEVLVDADLPLRRAAGPAGRVTFHDACHLAHPQQITAAPRRLVRAVAGADFVELPEADLCCGSAGTYNLTEPEMAARLQARKTRNLLATGATVVVTTNPGCILQMRAGLARSGAETVEVIHIADYLDRHCG